MESATITQETEQPMYQQGKYPSVVTTDDLVFELGRQLVGGLNKEKLLDTLLEKNKTTEKTLIEANKAVLGAEKKITDLKISNEQYVKNNQEMGSKIGKDKTTEDLLIAANKAKLVIEKEVANLRVSNEKYVENNRKLDSELVKIRKEFQESIKNYEINITELKTEHEKVLTKTKNLSNKNVKDEEIQKLKKRKPSRKRGK